MQLDSAMTLVPTQGRDKFEVPDHYVGSAEKLLSLPVNFDGPLVKGRVDIGLKFLALLRVTTRRNGWA